MKRNTVPSLILAGGSAFIVLGILCVFTSSKVFAYESVDQIPSDLSASQFYAQAVDHVSKGHCEIARECAKRAIKKDSAGPVGNRARQFLAANIPKNFVPKDAEQKNILAVNFMAKKNYNSAIAVLEDTVAEYPQFEWPFYNLSCMYLAQRNPSLAQAYAKKALKINPQYSNAWAAKANAYILERNFASAKECAQKALTFDPQNQTAAKMLQFLKQKTR